MLPSKDPIRRHIHVNSHWEQAKYHEKDWEEEGNEKKKRPGESQTLQDHLATGRYYMSLNKLPKR